MGRLTVTFRDTHIESAIFDRAVRDFMLAGVLSLIFLIITYLSSRTVFVTPLRALLSAIQDAQDQLIREPLAVQTKDEIGQVVGAYNNLVEKLEDEEREREKTSRLYRLIAEHTSDTLLVRKLSGENVYYSPSFERMSGYSMEELNELDDIAELVHPDDRPKIETRRKAMEAGRTDFEPERYRWIRKDGEIRWNEAKISIVQDLDDTDEVHFITAIHDITDLIEKQQELEQSQGELERQAEELIHLARDFEAAKNEAEQSSRMFQILAENATNWISLFDPKGNCYYASPSTESFGYTPEEIYSGRSVLNVVHPEHTRDLLRLRRKLVKGVVAEVPPYLSRIIRSDGDVRWCEIQLSLVPSREGSGEKDVLIAAHDVTGLEEAKLSAELNLETIQQDIDLARAMQQAIVPRSFPHHARYSAHAIMEAARQVGGDFYEFFQLDPRHIGVAIADVSGKGVSAAFFMAISRTLLETAAKSNFSPSAVLQDVNQKLFGQNPLFLFVTLFYGVLDLETGTLIYSNGGHNPPLLVRAGGQVDELPITEDHMLGIADDIQFHEQKMQLEDGDTLFLFTDGITEATNSGLSLFGETRLTEKLSSSAPYMPEEMVTHIRDAVFEFSGPVEQSDDLTCMAIRYNAPGTLSDEVNQIRLKPEPLDPNAIIEMEMVSNIQQVSAIHDQLSQFLGNWEVGKEVQFQVNVSFEEYVVNLISYGYLDHDRHMIHVTVTRTKRGLVIEIFDDGVPFNPLTAPEADVASSIEDRKIGGLGIHIIRTYMDQLSYLSRGGINRFTMTKNLD